MKRVFNSLLKFFFTFLLFFTVTLSAEAFCFTRLQLFKLQNSSMEDINLFLKSEGWKLIDLKSGVKSSSGLIFRWFVYTKDFESTLEIFNSENSGNIVSFKTYAACFQNISLQEFNDLKGSIEVWYNRVSTEYRNKDQIIHLHDFVTTGLGLPQIFIFNDKLKDQLTNLSVVYKTKDQNELLLIRIEEEKEKEKNDEIFDVVETQPNELLLIRIEEEKEKEKNDQIFDVVETQPNPPGGISGWNKYIADSINYPPQAKKMGVAGTVIVVFVINADGTIQDVDVLRSIGGGCDEEAVRIVKSAPAWEPGKNRGQPVRTRMRLPIRFKLPES